MSEILQADWQRVSDFVDDRFSEEVDAYGKSEWFEFRKFLSGETNRRYPGWGDDRRVLNLIETLWCEHHDIDA